MNYSLSHHSTSVLSNSPIALYYSTLLSFFFRGRRGETTNRRFRSPSKQNHHYRRRPREQPHHKSPRRRTPRPEGACVTTLLSRPPSPSSPFNNENVRVWLLQVRSAGCCPQKGASTRFWVESRSPSVASPFFAYFVAHRRLSIPLASLMPRHSWFSPAPRLCCSEAARFHSLFPPSPSQFVTLVSTPLLTLFSSTCRTSIFSLHDVPTKTFSVTGRVSISELSVPGSHRRPVFSLSSLPSACLRPKLSLSFKGRRSPVFPYCTASPSSALAVSYRTAE